MAFEKKTLKNVLLIDQKNPYFMNREFSQNTLINITKVGVTP